MNRKLFTLPIFMLLTAMLMACGTTPVSSLNKDTATQTLQSSDSIFTLTSPAVESGGRLPTEYTCDGASETLSLSWSGAPEGTQSYAVIMHHVAGPDDIHWYWVLYDIPADVSSLPRNVSGVGTLGNNVNNGAPNILHPAPRDPATRNISTPFTPFPAGGAGSRHETPPPR